MDWVVFMAAAALAGGAFGIGAVLGLVVAGWALVKMLDKVMR